MDFIADPPGESPSQVETPKSAKKRVKVRDAWISFVGRIVAQVVGAGASVAVGLMVLQRAQLGTPPLQPAAVQVAAALPQTPHVRRSGETALAVLPLDDYSEQADQEYLADGMTEALIASLAQIDGVRVISRTSTMRYKADRPSIPEVARALNVDLVVEGSVQQAGDRVRITAQLIDAQTDEHIWVESYDRTLRDILTLQDEVATAIAQAIKDSVTRRTASAGAARGSGPAIEIRSAVPETQAAAAEVTVAQIGVDQASCCDSRASTRPRTSRRQPLPRMTTRRRRDVPQRPYEERGPVVRAD